MKFFLRLRVTRKMQLKVSMSSSVELANGESQRKSNQRDHVRPLAIWLILTVSLLYPFDFLSSLYVVVKSCFIELALSLILCGRFYLSVTCINFYMKNIRGGYPLIHGNLFYYEFNVVQRKKWLFVDQYNVDILVRNKVQRGLCHDICVKSRARNNKFQSASHEICCFQTPKSTENPF